MRLDKGILMSYFNVNQNFENIRSRKIENKKISRFFLKTKLKNESGALQSLIQIAPK